MSKVKKSLAAIVAAGGIVAADANLNTAYEGTVVRILDSDTQEIRLAIFPGIEAVYKVRSIGVDTPEKYRPSKKCKLAERALALEATNHVKSLLQPGDPVRVSDVGIGKYAGRVLGSIWFQSADGEWLSLSQELINRGYAYEYWGGTKQSWCAQ